MRSKYLTGMFLAVLFLVSNIYLTEAAAFTREYERDFFYLGNKSFSFRIVVTIETEENGKWRFGNYYYTNLTLSLTYVNETQYDADFFRLLYHTPRLTVNDLPFGHGVFEIVTEMTNVTTISNGTIAIKYKPDAADGKTLQLKPLIEYTIYDRDQGLVFEPNWTPSEAIIVNVEEATSSPDYTNILTFVIVGAVIMIILTGVYLTYRSRKLRTSGPPKRQSALSARLARVGILCCCVSAVLIDI